MGADEKLPLLSGGIANKGVAKVDWANLTASEKAVARDQLEAEAREKHMKNRGPDGKVILDTREQELISGKDQARPRHEFRDRAAATKYMMPKHFPWLVSVDFTYERVRSRWATTFLVSAVFLILFIFIDVIMVEFPTVDGFLGPLVKFLLMFAVTILASISLFIMLVWNNPHLPGALIWQMGGFLSLGGGIAGVIAFLIVYHDDFAGSHSAEAGYFYFSMLGILLGGAVACYFWSFVKRETFHKQREEAFANNVADKLLGWRARLKQQLYKETMTDGQNATAAYQAAVQLSSGFSCHCGQVFCEVTNAVQHLRLAHGYEDHIFVTNNLATCLNSDLSKVDVDSTTKEFIIPHRDPKLAPCVGLLNQDGDEMLDKNVRKALKKRRKALRSKDIVLLPAVVLTGSIVSFTLLTFFFIKIIKHLPAWHNYLLSVRDRIQDIMNIVNTYDPGLVENFPDIPEFIDSFDGAFVACGAVAVVVAYLAATILTIIFPIVFFRSTLLRMRKGTCHDKSKNLSQPYMPKTHLLAKATYFIAVQFSTALIGFFLLAIGIFFSLIIPFWDVTRDIIVSMLDLIIAIVLVKIVQKVIFEKIIINLLISDGKRVRFPALWALLSIVGMFYTLFTGVITAIVRLFILIGLGVMALFRLDTTLYPRPLAMLDAGFVAFMSVVSMHNRYNNPIATVAVQILMDSARTDGRIKGKEGPPQTQSQLNRNRWMLAYTLINNPGLRGHRMSEEAKLARAKNQSNTLQKLGFNISAEDIKEKQEKGAKKRSMHKNTARGDIADQTDVQAIGADFATV